MTMRRLTDREVKLMGVGSIVVMFGFWASPYRRYVPFEWIAIGLFVVAAVTSWWQTHRKQLARPGDLPADPARQTPADPA